MASSRRLVAIVSLCAACQGRPPTGDTARGAPVVASAGPHVAEIDLRRGAPERADGSIFGTVRGRSFADLVTTLMPMPKQELVAGVFVRLGSAGTSLAAAEEIGRLLGKVREAGKPVVCHADGLGNATLLLAARGCSSVWLSPAGMVDSVGIAAQLVFGRALLDKLEVDVDFEQVGKFKGASEAFTRDGASPEARASLLTALGGLRQAWLAAIEQGRGKPAGKLGVEDGPHFADAAKRLGLVDRLGFEHEARQAALDEAKVAAKVSTFGGAAGPASLGDLVRILSSDRGGRVPHVAVLRATGAITMAGGSVFGSGEGIARQKLSAALARLGADESVKAVVLRVDSPGGSALASDLLWRDVLDLRAKKPVVVSVGQMAASGGYYLASAASKIVAERTSIVGSIGVVGGKLSFGRTLKKAGIHVESVAAAGDATRAVYSSPFAPWDDATRAKVRAAMEATYGLFLRRIAEGRKLGREAIAPAAEGRIMGGADAKAHQLIDALGGLAEAIELAIELAKLDPATPVRVVSEVSGLLGLLDPSRSDDAEDLADQARAQASKAVAVPLLPLGLPYAEHIADFVDGVAPLARGERVLAALPFVLAVR